MTGCEFNRAARHDGVTLVEVAVVLVVIGLITGVILAGRDLVRAAEVRATIGQLEQYNAAVQTYRGRFGGIPGDLQVAQASAFGFFAFTGANAGGVGLGDGNGVIENVNPTDSSPVAVGEPLAHFRHLSEAGLIDGAFGTEGNSAIVSSTGLPTGPITDVTRSLPPARLGRSNSIVGFSHAGRHYYELNAVTEIGANGEYIAASPQLTPAECFQLESKSDDGMPNTGHIVARGPGVSGALNQPPAVGDTACVEGLDLGDGYMLSNHIPACALRVRMSW